MAITGTISGTFQADDTRTVGLNTGAKIGINKAPAVAFTDGVGANQANILYHATRALTAGADNLDLNGAVTDAFGSSVVGLRVKAIYIKNNSASNTMVFGNHATAAWATFLNATGTLTLRPGAWIVAATPDATGWAITAATADTIKVAGTGTDSYDVAVLLGSS